MPLFDLDESIVPESPVLIAALDGWVNGGQAATLAAEELITDSRVVATFDGDQLFDYRSRRPTLDVIDGKLSELEWPRLELTTSRIEGRDLLILTGAEPDFRWHELADAIRTLVERLQVTSWVSLGAIPSTVAHTRPVPVLGTASSSGLLPAGVSQGPIGRLRVPAAALSVLELAVSGAGIASLGFFAQVPHYAAGNYPSAAIALLRCVSDYLAVELPIGELGRRALEARTLLDAATARDDATRTYIESLEQAADAAGTPSGEDLIADIERYLRDRGTEGGGREGGGDDRPN